MEEILKTLSQFNRREQTMLVTLAVLVVVLLIWLAVLSPLKHKRDQLILTTVSNEQALGRVQLLARQVEIQAQQSVQTGGGGEISGLIDASLRENSLSMSSFVPGPGGEVRVRIDKAGFEPAMQWFYDLENKHHIAIRELSMTGTNEPGQVSINVRLVKP